MYPDIRIIRRDELNNEIILVNSTLAKGKREKKGVRIETKWKLSKTCHTITFVSGSLITQFGKDPLMPSAIPDRHLRSVRELGNKIFKVKPFRGLRLFPPIIDDSLIVAERTITPTENGEKPSDPEIKVFVNKLDAVLWNLQRNNIDLSMRKGSSREVKRALKSKMTSLQIIRTAQENSYSIKCEYAKLVEQVVTGLAATKRFLVLNERGLNQKMLDYIWATVFGSESPVNVDSVKKKIAELLDTRL